MGTLASFAPMLGLLAGAIVARLAPTELKAGRIYFLAGQSLLLLLILLLARAGELVSYAVGGFVIVLLLCVIGWGRFRNRFYQHPLWFVPILALFSTVAPATRIPIFLYLIPTGTLSYKGTGMLVSYSAGYATVALITGYFF